MTFSLFFILIFFGYTAENISMPTWDEDDAETAIDLTDEPIEDLLSHMETQDEPDLELDSDWEKMESKETTEEEYYLEDETDTEEIISKVNADDQTDLESATTNTSRADQKTAVETSTKTLPEIGESVTEGITAGADNENNTETVSSIKIRPIAKILSDVVAKNESNLNTSSRIGKIISEVTTVQPNGKIPTQMKNINNTNFETSIALRKIESGEIADDESNSKTDKNIQYASSKMDRNDRVHWKTANYRHWKDRKCANKKIERKIVDSLNDFSTNCNIYKPIKFSLEHFVPPSVHRIKIGPKTYARVHDFTLEESKDDINWNNYATKINCEMDSMKIQASIAAKLIIEARVEMLGPPPMYAVLQNGSISVTYTDVSVSGKFSRNGTYEGPIEVDSSIEELFSNLHFVNSRATFQSIDEEHKVKIYRDIEKLFKTTKHATDFFINELKEKMQESSISYSNTCSNLKNTALDYNSSTPIRNTDFNHSYVIPHIKLEIIKGSTVHAGPIVIDGLLNFNSSEINNYLYCNISQEGIDNIIVEKVYKRITATNLKGKFYWKHHSKMNVLPFNIEQVEFRNFLSNGMNRQGRIVNDENMKKSRISVKIGKINIVTFRTKFRENENSFASFILSEYLESLISKSLQKSIEKRYNRTLLLQKKCEVLAS